MEFCFAAPSAFSFTSSRPLVTCTRPTGLLRRQRSRPVCSAGAPPPPSNEQPEDNEKGPNDEHDIPKTSVDWNSEWAKFTEGGMRTMAPRGREPVSKEDLMAARAMGKIRSVTDRVPTRQQLFKDWRFWVAIIAALSLFSAFVQSSQTVGGAVGPYGTI